MFTLSGQLAKKAAAAFLLVALFSIPVYAGAIVLLSPLQNETKILWHRVAPLSSVDDDGVPFQFWVYGRHTDGWTRLPDRAENVVFLTRLPGADTVTALAAIHHGAWWTYDAKQGNFKSVCWNIRFSTSGKCLDGDSRMEDMQVLQTKVVDGIVWVEAQT